MMRNTNFSTVRFTMGTCRGGKRRRRGMGPCDAAWRTWAHAAWQRGRAMCGPRAAATAPTTMLQVARTQRPARPHCATPWRRPHARPRRTLAVSGSCLLALPSEHSACSMRVPLWMSFTCPRRRGGRGRLKKEGGGRACCQTQGMAALQQPQQRQLHHSSAPWPQKGRAARRTPASKRAAPAQGQGKGCRSGINRQAATAGASQCLQA